MDSGPDGGMLAAEPPELAPMLEARGRCAVAVEVSPVHERAQVRIAHGAIDAKGSSDLVTIVDLCGAGSEEEAGRGADRVLPVDVVRRPVVVRAEIVEDPDAGSDPSCSVAEYRLKTSSSEPESLLNPKLISASYPLAKKSTVRSP